MRIRAFDASAATRSVQQMHWCAYGHASTLDHRNWPTDAVARAAPSPRCRSTIVDDSPGAAYFADLMPPLAPGIYLHILKYLHVTFLSASSAPWPTHLVRHDRRARSCRRATLFFSRRRHWCMHWTWSSVHRLKTCKCTELRPGRLESRIAFWSANHHASASHATCAD